MVDRLQKFGMWIWLNKERMVLIVLVGFLVYRVYQVVNPTDTGKDPVVSPPKGLPDDPEERKELIAKGVLPQQAGPPPPVGAPGDYVELYRSNPFWYYSTKRAAKTNDTRITAERLGLELVDIQRAGGQLRARIKTTATTKWYNEGDAFEEFELLRIDPEQRSVEINAKLYGVRVTVSQSR